MGSIGDAFKGAPKPKEKDFKNEHSDQQLRYFYDAISKYAGEKGYSSTPFTMPTGSRPYGPQGPSQKQSLVSEYEVDENQNLYDPETDQKVGIYMPEKNLPSESTVEYADKKLSQAEDQTEEDDLSRFEKFQKLAEELERVRRSGR